MTKYLLVYRGGSMPEGKEAQEQSAAAWGQWFGGLGGALVDPGNPAFQSRSVSPDGTVSGVGPSSVSGYSIISADSLDAAVAHARSCPVLQVGASIEVVETPEMM